jgi:hypothetical protein
MRKDTVALALAALAATALIGTAGRAGASDRGEREGHEHQGEHEGRTRTGRGATSDPAARALYAKECGACHLDFPPGLLPAGSHRRILAGLDRHFGQDAELDPAVRDRLERYLVESAADAGSGRASGEVPLRITELGWFQRKHRKIGADVVARPAVRSRANCAACHPGAAGWDFDDDRVKIPR